jgi:hypothetical protein
MAVFMLLHGTSKRLFPRGRQMIGALSVVGVVVGAAFACMAGRHPRHRQVMETTGGVLLITGFALLGYALECVLGPPSY